MLKKQLAIIVIMVMTFFIGFAVIIPVMPVMIKDEAGASEFHLGMMLAIYSLASFLMSPLWGSISDRIGRRPVLMTGLIGFAISFIMFGLSDGELWIMYVSRVFGGLFSGAATACAVAYVADITTEKDRTKSMGLVGMAIGLGFMIGPAVGGLLSHFGNAVPFFFSAGLALVTFIFAYFYLKESLPSERRKKVKFRERKPSRWTAFTGVLKYLYVLSFFVSFTLAGLEATLQFFGIERFQVTPEEMGWLFLVSGIVGAGIQGGVVRRMIKPGDESKVILIGLLFSAAGFFLLVTAYSLWTVMLFLSIYSIGNALIRPCVTSLITQKTTVGQGVASGLNSSMDSLGRIAGPLLGTGLFQIKDSFPYIAGGFLSIAAIWLVYRFVKLSVRATMSVESEK